MLALLRERERIPLTNPSVFIMNLRSRVEWRRNWTAMPEQPTDFYGEVGTDHFLLLPLRRYTRRSPFSVRGVVVTAPAGDVYCEVVYSSVDWRLAVVLSFAAIWLLGAVLLLPTDPLHGAFFGGLSAATVAMLYADFLLKRSRARRLMRRCLSGGSENAESVQGEMAKVADSPSELHVGTLRFGHSELRKLVTLGGIPLYLRRVPVQSIERYSVEDLSRFPSLIRVVFFHPRSDHFLKFTATGFLDAERELPLIRGWAARLSIPEG